MRSARLATTSLFALLLACGETPSAPAAQATPAPTPREPTPAAFTLAPPAGRAADIDFLARIDSDDDWARLAASSDEHAIARVEVVKVLLDLSSDTLYFCQSERWPLHYDFAVRFLQTDARPLGDRRTFNRRNYLRDDREMILGTVAHYLDADVWALELGPADTLSGARVEAFHARVASALHRGDALRFHPRSDVHERSIAGTTMPLVRESELWRAVSYQALTLGTAYGHLRFLGSTDEARAGDIVVLREGPDELPPLAGVVVSRLQSLLSHVSVLSQGRGTPALARPGAFDDPSLRALEGSPVRLDVERDAFRVVPATLDELEGARATRASAPELALDLGPRALRTLDELRAADAAAYGAKAAQLGEARSIGAPVRTFDGFAIPVAYFHEHLERALPPDRRPWARGMPEAAADRDRVLREARAAITSAPVDGALLAEVERALARLGGTQFFFRSSTNAEDLVGMSGAGLYDSVRVEGSGHDAIARPHERLGERALASRFRRA